MMQQCSDRPRRAPEMVAGFPVGQVIKITNGFFTRCGDGNIGLDPHAWTVIERAVTHAGINTVVEFRADGLTVRVIYAEVEGGVYKDPPVQWILLEIDSEDLDEAEVYSGPVLAVNDVCEILLKHARAGAPK